MMDIDRAAFVGIAIVVCIGYVSFVWHPAIMALPAFVAGWCGVMLLCPTKGR